MSNIISVINSYLQFAFVRNAITVGVLIALCSSLLGVTLVLKRYSYIGDGLSHVAFGAMAVANVLGMAKQSTFIVMPVTVFVAVLLLKTGQNKKINGDALIAMLSVGALAFGYMLMNIFPPGSNISGDVCVTLFGSFSILTLSGNQVIVCVIMSIVVISIYIMFYNRIFAVTFDENFAKATGIKTDRFNLLIAVIIAVIIVLGMNLVGSLLISALVIFPALSAMRIINNFKGVVLCSAVISVLCSFLGMVVSIVMSAPVGSTIVATNMIVFIICFIAGKIMGI
ncbi:metal ABC transporter permease [Johnsonella ignava]|uniref:metal ABC transporter permease n=1 Tax=Johnsonella ignava TaxID=43995 RepID=UPI0023F29081|nr:metal ABC transporter permease [Johnsonella ignava]